MAKWCFYVLVFVYMCYRAVYGAKVATSILSVDEINYGDDGFLSVGSEQTVNCKVSNRNQKLEWLDPSGEVVKRNIPALRVHAQERFVGKGSRALALTLSDLMVSDTGVYQCRSGDQKRNVSICVIKPTEFVDTPSEMTIEAGRSITLSCQATGDPEPRIVWYNEGGEIQESDTHLKYRVNRKYNSKGYESLLTITQLEPYDGGIYTCVALQESPIIDNCTYSKDFNVTLRISHAPLFRRGNSTKYVYGKTNEIVGIQCKAMGWPEPTYRWFKDLGGDTLYEFDKTKFKLEEPNTAVLSVTAGRTTFDNTYKCVASNSFGDTEKYFKLVERTKPRVITEVQQLFATSTIIIFNATWETEVPFPIDGVDIQYIETSKLGSRIPKKESDWRNCITVHKEVDFELYGHYDDGIIELAVKLDELELATEYYVRMRVTNVAGTAAWSDPISGITTDGDEAEEGGDPPEKHSESETDIEGNNNGGLFYGIFFVGGIIIFVVVSVFVMKLV